MVNSGASVPYTSYRESADLTGDRQGEAQGSQHVANVALFFVFFDRWVVDIHGVDASSLPLSSQVCP